MNSGNVTISFIGSSDLSNDVENALGDFEYTEVETNQMTGGENELSWLIAAVLGSPVLSKTIDFFEKTISGKKISKVTISKDGKVEIEGASPTEAIKILRALESKKEKNKPK